jgi:hypothetical protein
VVTIPAGSGVLGSLSLTVGTLPASIGGGADMVFSYVTTPLSVMCVHVHMDVVGTRAHAWTAVHRVPSLRCPLPLCLVC